MAEFSARRVVVIAAVAGALVGGAVTGGVAEATGGNHDSLASSPAGGSPVATAAVVRTTLATTVEVGGSIGYDGSYTVAAPSGASVQQLAQAQQAVTEDQQALTGDQTMNRTAPPPTPRPGRPPRATPVPPGPLSARMRPSRAGTAPGKGPPRRRAARTPRRLARTKPS